MDAASADGVVGVRLSVNLNHDRRMRDSKQFREDHAGLAVARVVGLKSGKNKVGVLFANGVSDRFGDLKTKILVRILAMTWIARSAPRAKASLIPSFTAALRSE